MKNVVLMLIAVSLSACWDEEKKHVDAKLMYGDWQAHSLRITMNSYNNKDSVAYFEVAHGEWPVKMNMQPALYVYGRDGSYHSYNREINGKMEPGPAGYWKIENDSISIRDTFPQKGSRYAYKIEFNGDQVRMWGREDCDNDGKADDDYFSVMTRFK